MCLVYSAVSSRVRAYVCAGSCALALTRIELVGFHFVRGQVLDRPPSLAKHCCCHCVKRARCFAWLVSVHLARRLQVCGVSAIISHYVTHVTQPANIIGSILFGFVGWLAERRRRNPWCWRFSLHIPQMSFTYSLQECGLLGRSF